MPGLFTTGFQESGVDIGDISKGLVEKSYLMDVYPGLIPTFAAPGLWLWGANVSGQLGTNDTTGRSSPVQTITASSNWKQVSTTSTGVTIGAIKTDGTLWMWGNGISGQLGTNNTTNRSSPVQTVAGGTNWKQVSCGQGIAAIKTDGTLWMWGGNFTGHLGDNTTTDRSSPVQTVAGGTNWKQVSISTHTGATKTDGTLWLWGYNAQGQLGDNTTVSKSSPVQTVGGGTNWKQVSTGDNHTAAIKNDGTLWLWGLNDNGQLGDNTISNRSSPVQTVAGGTNWKQVSCATSHTAAIKNDGTLWLWGQNNPGMLGDNTLTSRSSPVQTVAGGTNWKQVSTGFRSTAAIKTDGTLWLWGYNVPGNLGDNTTTPKSSPVQTVAGGTNWKQISLGSEVAAAIREFGDW